MAALFSCSHNTTDVAPGSRRPCARLNFTVNSTRLKTSYLGPHGESCSPKGSVSSYGSVKDSDVAAASILYNVNFSNDHYDEIFKFVPV